jgi:hypothetical protein
MKKITITLGLIITLSMQSQTIHYNLLGYFKNTKEQSLYSYFSFDNNGKVNIMGLNNGDYFIKGDTLIVFPDKDLFKFKIEKDKLIGVSNWVQDGVWEFKKDSIVKNNRKDNDLANKSAVLLNEYYEKTRMKNNQMDLLFDENLMKEYRKTIESLCERNLVRACKEQFGLATLDNLGGFEKVMSKKESELKESPDMLNLANKVIQLDPGEGYNLLSLYYTMHKQTDKANEASDKAIELGNKEVMLSKIAAELNNSDVYTKPQNTNEDKTSDFEPIFDDTLRMINEKSFSEIDEYLKKNYGFKVFDKIESENFDSKDYQNKSFDVISKFVYKNGTDNRVEYTTKDVEKIKNFKNNLKNYTRTETKNLKTGELTENYMLEIKLGKGYVQKCHVQILYPTIEKINEPITVLLLK